MPNRVGNSAEQLWGLSASVIRITSYLDSAAAHGITALDAIRAAIEGRPWLPPLPAVS